MKNKEVLRTKKSSKRRILTFCILCIFGLILILGFVDLYVSNFTLKITRYSLESTKFKGSVRIVQLSDLHEKNFGKNNEKLIQKVKSQSPDIIVLTGDIIDRNSKDDPSIYVSELLSALREIAPIYMCIGNHELNSKFFDEFKEAVSKQEVCLLDSNYKDITIKGEEIRIGSLSYYRSWDEGHHQYLKDFTDTDRFTLLLCHYPEYYIWGVKKYPIDLMLSGHTHAGMIRLPFLGGLYAPEQGWLPEFEKGLFTGENTTLIISAGLASSPRYMPRLNNPPEIVSIEIN